jgi:hypothetical protein
LCNFLALLHRQSAVPHVAKQRLPELIEEPGDINSQVGPVSTWSRPRRWPERISTTDQIAGAVQTATAADIEGKQRRARPGGLHEPAIEWCVSQRNAGNPFQPDVNFRGYTASPLLGTPEGVSVYVDGVRQNQPFGDVVSWDLIPKDAISEITLVPGSDPLFGLNTLGGALSVQTKNGVYQSRAPMER